MNSKGSYSFEEIPSVETLQGKYTRTSYVCHHSACQDKNKHRPFMLCRSCDKSLHSDPQYTGHLRLDLPKGSSLAHSPLTRSLPSQVNCDFSDGEAEDDFAAPVKHDDKNIKFSSNSSPKLESKFRRKKACKRHHAESQRSKSLTQIDYLQAETMKRDTLDSRSEPDMVELGHEKCLIFEDSKDKDDKESSPVERKQSPKFMIKSPSKANSAEEFTVCFDMFEGTVTESVPATRGVNLKDAMSGIIEKHGLDVDSINIFLEASNTPLSWQFDSFPFGGNILHVKDIEFCPASITDRELPENLQVGVLPTEPVVLDQLQECTIQISNKGNPVHGIDPENIPSTSQQNVALPSTSGLCSSISPQMIRPFPKASPRKCSSRGRKKRGTVILTDTPVKNALEQEKAAVKQKKYGDTIGKAKRNLLSTTLKQPKGKKKKQDQIQQDDSDTSDDEWSCLVCFKPYSTSKEVWDQCTSCLGWSHVKCTNNELFYVCPNCKSDSDESEEE